MYREKAGQNDMFYYFFHFQKELIFLPGFNEYSTQCVYIMCVYIHVV